MLAEKEEVTTRSRPALGDQLSRVVAANLLLDCVMIAAAITFGWQNRAFLDFLVPGADVNVAGVLTPMLFVVWIGMLGARGAYRRHIVGAGFDEFRSVLQASVLAFGLMATVVFLLDADFSRRFLLLALLIGTPLLFLERYAVRKAVHLARRRGHLRGRVIVVGTPLALSELVSTLDRVNSVGYSIVGTVLPERESGRDLTLPVPLYGGVDDIMQACRDAQADTVIVAGGGLVNSSVLRRIGWNLEGQDIDLVVVPSLVDVAGPRIHMRHVSGLPLVHVEEPQAGRAGGLSKRVFDLVATLTVLIALSPALVPLLAFVAFRIKKEDGGPIFYRQERCGRNGEIFRITKFRSMAMDADARLAELLAQSDSPEVFFKMKQDPRITKIGHFIRRYSIDELPQLWDVLRGDMSLVGPRPQSRKEVEAYPPDMHRRLLVRPGLTGLWQVSGRSDLAIDESIRLDLYYVDNWSITADLLIMLKTIRAVVATSGAY